MLFRYFFIQGACRGQGRGHLARDNNVSLIMIMSRGNRRKAAAWHDIDNENFRYFCDFCVTKQPHLFCGTSQFLNRSVIKGRLCRPAGRPAGRPRNYCVIK